MSAQDALWLSMDRPNNLMVIDGVMLLRGTPDPDAIADVIRERVVERFPVFSCRPIHDGTGWGWEPDPDFELSRHATTISLDETATLADVEDFVARQRAERLDRQHPLWQVTLISPVILSDGSPGSALVSRFHHAMADGVRLTMVMLSLCDNEHPGVLAKVASPQSGPGGLAGVVASTVHATTSLARDSLHLATVTTMALVRGGPSAVTEGLEIATDVVRRPDRLSGVLEEVGVTNRITDDLTSIAKLTLRGPSVQTVWSGTPGPAKSIVWSAPLSLTDVKRVARTQGASVNDVLLTAIAGGVRRYLAQRGESGVDEIEWMVPVNLVPLEDNLPEDLGNYFALVMIVLPLFPHDPVARLAATRVRMARIKRSDEAALTFTIQRGISASPRTLSVALTNFFANKAVGVLTNVPGPRDRMLLAGVDVDQVIGFAPCSGDQPMTATIFSYADTVTVGFAVDAGLVSDPRLLVDGTVAELRLLVERSDGTVPRGEPSRVENADG